MLIEQHDLAQTVQELEALPPTATRLATLLCRADWDIQDVEEAIAFDQALTAKLLRLANSALWFRGRTIATVRDAVMRLGSGTVVGLALGAGVQKNLLRALPQYGLREGELWTHSVAATLAASMLNARTRANVPIEAPASALLHDVGKLVLARYLEPDRAHRIEEVRRNDGLSRNEAELAVLGVDHAELGGLVGRNWNLPERIVTGIVHHHSPEATADPIGSVIHMTDVLAHRAQRLLVGALRDEPPPAPRPEALACLALTAIDLDAIAGDVAKELADVLRRYV